MVREEKDGEEPSIKNYSFSKGILGRVFLGGEFVFLFERSSKG